MNCSNCGATLTDGTNFCPTCGARVQSQTNPQQPFEANTVYTQPAPVPQQAPAGPPTPINQMNSQADPGNSAPSAATAEKKSHTWIWVVGIILVLLAVSYGMLGRGGFTASTSNPASAKDFSTYILNKGYSPNKRTGAYDLQLLGYTNVDDGAWYGDGGGLYDAEVSCNGTNYHLRYTSSGSDKGWQILKFMQPQYGIEDDLRACSVS